MAQTERPKRASYNELPAKEITLSSDASPKIVTTPVTSIAPAIIVGAPAKVDPAPAAPVASAAPVAPASVAPASGTARFEEMQRVLRQRIIRNIGGKYVEDGESALEIYFEGGHKLKIIGNFKFNFSR